LVAEDDGDGGAQRMQGPGVQDKRAQRHAQQGQYVVDGGKGRPGQQDGEDAHTGVGAVGDAIAQFAQPPGGFEMMAPEADDPITGDELNEDRKRHEHEAEAGLEADAGGDVQEADWKTQERKNEEQPERDPGWEAISGGVHRIDVESTVRERHDGAQHHRHRSDFSPGKIGETKGLSREPATHQRFRASR